MQRRAVDQNAAQAHSAPARPDDGLSRPAGSENDDFVAALARGLSVIRAFANQHERLTLAEIGRLVGLPRATARRCLITLVALDYIQSDGKYFSLSPKILTLSQAYFSSNALPHIARPLIEEVSRSVQESCSVSVLAGDEIIYVARSTMRRPGSTFRDVGENLPAYCTSMGRVLLANLPAGQLDAYFARVTLCKFNEKTVATESELRNILEQVREQDFAVIDGEFEPGLRAVAVPVRNRRGAVLAAAHVSTTRNSPLDTLVARFLPPLRDAVAQMHQSLV